VEHPGYQATAGGVSMSRTKLYRHPDGEGSIEFDTASSRLFLFNDAEGLSAYAVIGPDCLRELAAKLMTLADESELPF
jgi:uncharacterized membrane protein YeiH